MGIAGFYKRLSGGGAKERRVSVETFVKEMVESVSVGADIC